MLNFKARDAGEAVEIKEIPRFKGKIGANQDSCRRGTIDQETRQILGKKHKESRLKKEEGK